MTNDNETDLVLAKLETAQLALEKKQLEFAAYLTEVKQHEENVKKLKGELYEKMKETGVKTLETPHFVVRATWDYTRHNYDMKKLKAMNPKLFKQVDDLVGNDTLVKGSAKITVKTA